MPTIASKKARNTITVFVLLVTVCLITIVLMFRAYHAPTLHIKSVSPDAQYTARFFQLKQLIDKNYRITVRDNQTNSLIAEYSTPDERPFDDSVKFIWNTDATAVLLVGNAFYTDTTPRNCQPTAYLLINTVTAQIWTAASADAHQTPTLTNTILQQFHFCDDNNEAQNP